MTQTYVYVPEEWLTSTIRALKEYVETGLDNSVLVSNDPSGLYDPVSNPAGIYEVVMEFPGPQVERDKVPLPRTLIHLAVDAIDDNIIGIGKNYGRQSYNPVTHNVELQEAREHRVNFDIGIWTSDRAGGTTRRMIVYEVLDNLFHGSMAQDSLDAAADAGDGRIEIISYTGGRFITETMNDVPTYRMVDGTLEVRVFSRTPLSAVTVPAIEQLGQSPGLTITE